jgi:hypothetical protein
MTSTLHSPESAQDIQSRMVVQLQQWLEDPDPRQTTDDDEPQWFVQLPSSPSTSSSSAAVRVKIEDVLPGRGRVLSNIEEDEDEHAGNGFVTAPLNRSRPPQPPPPVIEEEKSDSDSEGDSDSGKSDNDTDLLQSMARVKISLNSQNAEFDKKRADIAKVIKEQAGQYATEFGDKVVFLDLEWHQLNQKVEYEMNKDEQSVMTHSHIAQLCAISANYKIRFNQYVFYRPLAVNWQQLINWGFLDPSKQDDPRIAISFEECMELFCKTFEQGTLFLHYGSTDGSAIFRDLAATVDYIGRRSAKDTSGSIVPVPKAIRDKREALTNRMIAQEYKWANIQTWIKDLNIDEDELPRGGSLSVLYDNLFHKALLIKMREGMQDPRVIVSDATTDGINQFVKPFPDCMLDKGNFGLVPKCWLHVTSDRQLKRDDWKGIFPKFWPTKHLQPQFHEAHTDTVMLINCVAMIAIFDQEMAKKKLSVEHWFMELGMTIDHHLAADPARMENLESSSLHNELASALIIKTRFFREFQLSISEATSEQLWNFYNANNRCRDSERLASLSVVKQSKLAASSSSSSSTPPQRVRFSLRTRDQQAIKELLDQDRKEQAAEEKWASAPTTGKNRQMFPIIKKVGGEETFATGLTTQRGQFTEKVKAIRRMLLDGTKDAELKDSLSKQAFSNRSRELKYPADKLKSYDNLPWFTSNSTPNVSVNRTILHTLHCYSFSDPDDHRMTRNFAEINLNMVNFDLLAKAKQPLYAQYQFCKECKQYDVGYYNKPMAAAIPTTVTHTKKRETIVIDDDDSDDVVASVVPRKSSSIVSSKIKPPIIPKINRYSAMGAMFLASALIRLDPHRI